MEVNYPENYFEKIKRKKVNLYDCFQFFNEIELLELRLEIMDPAVDYFVLVEARQNHQRKDKPLYFEENKKKFDKWKDKIIHVVVDLPKFNLFDKFVLYLEKKGHQKLARRIGGRGFWGMGLGGLKSDHYQRMYTIEGLKYSRDEDIIILSDLDDIPNPEKIKRAIEKLEENYVISFQTIMHSYYLNGRTYNSDGQVLLGEGVKMCRIKTLRKKFLSNPHFLRSPRDSLLGLLKVIIPTKSYVLKNGGWSFSSLGGIEKVITKFSSFAHSEYNTKDNLDRKNLQKMLDEGALIGHPEVKIDYMRIDKSFPEIIRKNQKKYEKLIK